MADMFPVPVKLYEYRSIDPPEPPPDPPNPPKDSVPSLLSIPLSIKLFVAFI